MTTANYTRQRQGRDFLVPAAVSGIKEETRKKSLLKALEQSVIEAERAKIPVDGLEPEGKVAEIDL